MCVKIFNQVVEIFKLSYVELDFEPLSRESMMLKTDVRAREDALLPMDGYQHD